MFFTVFLCTEVSAKVTTTSTAVGTSTDSSTTIVTSTTATTTTTTAGYLVVSIVGSTTLQLPEATLSLTAQVDSSDTEDSHTGTYSQQTNIRYQHWDFFEFK